MCRLHWWRAAHTGWHPENVSLKPTANSHWAGSASRSAPRCLGFPCCPHNAAHSHTGASVCMCVWETERETCVPLCTHTHILGTERSLSVNETRRGGVKLVCSDLLYRTFMLFTVVSLFGIHIWKQLHQLKQKCKQCKGNTTQTRVIAHLLFVHLVSLFTLFTLFTLQC